MATGGLQAGEVVKTTIDAVAFGGAGVGRVKGMVVFAPFTVTGDEVELEIGEVRKKFALGKLRRILTPSRYRIAPLCRYFGQCGGCQLQHVAYEHQLELKEKQVREIFERLGKFSSPPLLDIIPSPERFNYRGKADYHVRTAKEGDIPAVGFMHASEDRVLDIERCEIVEESINLACLAFRENLFRSGRATKNKRQTIWSAAGGEDYLGGGNSDEPALVMRTVKNRRLIVPYRGFFQINNSLVDLLVDKVIDLCELTGVEMVLDGYCGAGLFSFFLAPQACSVTGVEINGGALQCARSNLQEAGLLNAVFFQGEIGGIIKQKLIKRGMKADVLVLDPPRSGCRKEVLDAVREMQPKKIVYISCNPSTQARDIRYLVDNGFSIKLLQPLDMFPQTGHIEVIGLLFHPPVIRL